MILASDYDFTLHFEDGISSDDLKMIQTFQEKGGLFGLISGRSISSLQHEIKKHKIPYDFIIGVNGGFILDKSQNELFASYISKQDTLAIIQYLNNVPPSSYTIHNGYDLARKVFDEDFALNIGVEFISFDAILQKDISGFFINYHSNDEATKEAKTLNQKFPNIQAHVNGSFVDITALNINKKEGLKMLVQSLNIHQDIWVIGDAENDLEMVSYFPSFAMCHGNENLKEKADYVVGSVAEAISVILSQQ